MGCGCNGKGRLARLNGQFIDLPRNDRSMVTLTGDVYECQAYDGAFTGTHVYVADHLGEHERIFLRQNRRDAINYANEHGVKVGNLINVKSLCATRVLEVLGA